MKVKTEQLKANRFRDFELYPIDEEQVQRLSQSMDSLGFFSGVTARRVNGGFELAAGHHRIQAARELGLNEVEAVVEDYTDQQMVEIMMTENMTQRGHNAASVLDSVAAYAKLITKEVLLGEGESAKILALSRNGLAKTQTTIAKDGPGTSVLYRAMNGFHKADRRANKDAEIITSSEIDHALANLKSSGLMGKLVGEIYEEVKVIRAERAAKEAERQRQAEAKAREEQERAEAELKRKQEAEAEAVRKAEEAARAAEQASAAKKEKALADARKAEEEAAKRHAETEAAEAANEEKRKKAAKEEDARRKQEAEQAERDEKERKAIAEQEAREAIYDSRCAHIFRLSSHEKTFREFMVSPNGLRFIPKSKQYELAQKIRSEIDAIEKEKSIDVGSVTIGMMLNGYLSKVMGMQRDIDKREREEIERQQAQTRVDNLWTNLRRGAANAESALRALVDEQKKWPYDKALFPMHLEDIDRLISAGKQMEKLKKALGY